MLSSPIKLGSRRLFLALHSVILASYYIVQTWIIRDYPFCRADEKDANAWKTEKPNINLMAIGYSGSFCVITSIRTSITMGIKEGKRDQSMFPCLSHLEWSLQLCPGGCIPGGITFILEATIGSWLYAVIWPGTREAYGG
ncbi:hypothetical protein Pint_23037 [Pistacia integerrima]|uniref:Uncharacterized protein n=1 Tax=Pistacia integerrima TaxID=434235 RepID=A0ACC0YKT9_9ROSI|nr:hypothetical protein Pint_23037 [Pistacia integerrima]